jgi:26S proteasome regulatory subunit T3
MPLVDLPRGARWCSLPVQKTRSPRKKKGEHNDGLFTAMKKKQNHLKFLLVQEDYIKDEQRNLKRELLRAQEEVKRIQSVPLVIGQFLEMIDGSSGIVSSTTGSNYYVSILSTLNREDLKVSALDSLRE